MAAARAGFAAVIVQIAIIDIVFSLDSVITAVGMVEKVSIMVLAIVAAVAVMMVRGGADRRVRRPSSHGEDARAEFPDARRRGADRRRVRTTTYRGAISTSRWHSRSGSRS